MKNILELPAGSVVRLLKTNTYLFVCDTLEMGKHTKSCDGYIVLEDDDAEDFVIEFMPIG